MNDCNSTLTSQSNWLQENRQDISFANLHGPVEKNKSAAEARSHSKDDCGFFISCLCADTHCGFQMIAHPVAEKFPIGRIGVMDEYRPGSVFVTERFQNGCLQ
jgi:hypothetical protein